MQPLPRLWLVALQGDNQGVDDRQLLFAPFRTASKCHSGGAAVVVRKVHPATKAHHTPQHRCFTSMAHIKK